MSAATSAVSTAVLLAAWERGLVEASPGRRALGLLEAVEPDAGWTASAERTVGERDAALLRLRARAFGEELECLARCTTCAQELEIDLAVGDVLLPPAALPTELTVRDGPYRVRFRLPSALDAAALWDPGAVGRPESTLLERCVVAAEVDGRACAVAELPDRVVEQVAARMAQADPQADVELAVACPSCGTAATVTFDIVGFLWRELDAWARRLLREVHVLATAYGWSEPDILALGEHRRRWYLDLVGA